MNIRECLLNADNPQVISGVSIGERIASRGKRSLWDGRVKGIIDTIVVHYISAVEVMPKCPYQQGMILKIFCDYGVSSHYLINRGGAVTRLVPESERAWHCGGSLMPEPDNRHGVNEFSIGIELVATPVACFTAAQYQSLARLCFSIEGRYGKKMNYVGHDQIAGERSVKLGLRRDAKVDPGKLFDWEYFYRLIGKSGY